MIYHCSNQKRISEGSSVLDCTIEYVLDYFKNKTYIGIDAETSGLDPHTCEILSFQLGDFDNQFVIDCTTIDIKLFKELLEDESKVFILQNAKFDLKFLYKHGIIIKKLYDTMLAEMVLNTGLKIKKNLGVLAFKYCNIILDKSVRGEINRQGLTDNVIVYAANDVKYLEKIMHAQLEELKKNNLIKAIKLDNKFVRVLAYIEYCGIYLNPELWEKKMEEDQMIINENKFLLDKWVLENCGSNWEDKQSSLFDGRKSTRINWKSQKEIVKLFQELGINTKVVDKATKKMKDSIEAPMLEIQADKFPIIPLFLKYKKAEDALSSFGQNYLNSINPKTGRIHAEFTQIVKTGRVVSGGGEAGLNIQGVPKGPARSCFTPQRKDNVLIDCDYSEYEDRIFADLCKDPKLIEFYNDPQERDGHAFVAKLCFPRELKGIDEKNVKKEFPELRSKAKEAKFSILFGGNGHTIASRLGISKEEGEDIYNAYMDVFSGIKEYLLEIKNIVLKNGFVQFNDVTKRKSYYDRYDRMKYLERKIDNKFWEEYKKEKLVKSEKFYCYYKPIIYEYNELIGELTRKAYNYRAQGTGADILKTACCKLFDWIVENGLFNVVLITNIAHDEILLESPKNISEDVANNVKKFMIEAGEIFVKSVPIKVEPEIDIYWKH